MLLRINLWKDWFVLAFFYCPFHPPKKYCFPTQNHFITNSTKQETAPTTLVYLNKDKKAEERKKSGTCLFLLPPLPSSPFSPFPPTDPPPTASPSSLKHNNSFSLGDFTASTADKMKFEKHKGETAMEFANRRVLLGWANHRFFFFSFSFFFFFSFSLHLFSFSPFLLFFRLSLSDKEAIVDIVSDFSNGIALCHLLEALTDSTLKVFFFFPPLSPPSFSSF